MSKIFIHVMQFLFKYLIFPFSVMPLSISTQMVSGGIQRNIPHGVANGKARYCYSIEALRSQSGIAGGSTLTFNGRAGLI
jgi:hypothetical protein